MSVGGAQESPDRGSQVLELVRAIDRGQKVDPEAIDLLDEGGESLVDGGEEEALLGAESLGDHPVTEAELSVERTKRHGLVALGGERLQCSIEDLVVLVDAGSPRVSGGVSGAGLGST
jgi:hypothetical protein